MRKLIEQTTIGFPVQILEIDKAIAVHPDQDAQADQAAQAQPTLIPFDIINFLVDEPKLSTQEFVEMNRVVGRCNLPPQRLTCSATEPVSVSIVRTCQTLTGSVAEHVKRCGGRCSATELVSVSIVLAMCKDVSDLRRVLNILTTQNIQRNAISIAMIRGEIARREALTAQTGTVQTAPVQPAPTQTMINFTVIPKTIPPEYGFHMLQIMKLARITMSPFDLKPVTASFALEESGSVDLTAFSVLVKVLEATKFIYNDLAIKALRQEIIRRAQNE